MQTCKLEGCKKEVRSKQSGICEMHYYRMRRNGDYHKHKPRRVPTIEFRVDENNCFIVTSHTPLNTGYFLFHLRDGVRKSMHRLVYEECFGEIPDGLVVRHKCDVRGCINPEHLELGTQADNVMDTVKRNRTLRGVDSPTSKLSEETVRKIKTMLAAGIRNIDISRELNVNPSTICNIKHGGAWKHII